MTKTLPKITRFDPKQIDNGTLKIPRRALRFAAEVEISDEPKQAEENAPETIPISVRARSGNVLAHWFWGRCIHDFAGMRPASAKLPFDYCHDDREVLGFSDRQDVTDGLNMHGVLIPFKEQDRVDEVVTKAAAGFEWQGSIYFDSDELVLEYVPEGMTAPVNGGQFEGPGVIFRQWMLRGAAICPYGYDPNTSVQLSNQPGDEVAICFQESIAMAKKPKKTSLNKPAPNRHGRRKAASLAKGSKPKSRRPASTLTKPKTKLESPEDDDEEEDEVAASAEEMEDEDSPEDSTETEEDEDECECAGEEGCECDEEAGDDEEEEPVEMEDDEEEGQQTKHGAKSRKGKLSAAQKEAQSFITSFGKQGGVWFAQGKTYAEAQTLFNANLKKQNADLQKKVSELSAQVSALGGEEEPVTFTSADEKPGKQKPKGKQISGLTGGAAKFAAAVKIRQ